MKAQGQLAATLFIVLAVPAVSAGEGSHPCAQQYSDAQRLACYDATFGKPRPPGSATPSPVATSPAPAPVLSLPARPVEAPAPAVAVVKAEPPAVKKEAAPRPTKFTSNIVSLKTSSSGRHEVTLENGEVWGQVESDPQAVFRIGDRVTIRPALMGSYILEPATGLPTRVRRVK